MCVLVSFWQIASSWEWCASAEGDMGVLAHKQRFEATLFKRARQLSDVHPVVGWKVVGANKHSPLLGADCICGSIVSTNWRGFAISTRLQRPSGRKGCPIAWLAQCGPR